MGAIEKTLEALDERVGGACQVVAICGRNKALIERLSNRSAFSPWLKLHASVQVLHPVPHVQHCLAGHSAEG